MVTTSYKIICWVVTFILLKYVNCQREVGDFCTLQRTGASGQCQLLQNCPAAIQALQSQIYPQNCGFKGAEPIVCCAGTTPNTTPTPTRKPTPATVVTVPTRPITQAPPPVTPPTTKSTVPPVPLRVGDKSKQKCREYGRYVYVTAIAGQADVEDCAIVDVQLIVGGVPAKPKEFAHMATVGFETDTKEVKWQCGGTLISDRFVLTAAHCLYDQELGEPKYIRVGDLVLNTNRDDADPQEFGIIERIKHPSYRPPSQYNDIALLKLDRKAKLSIYTRPACLETNAALNLTRKPIASGWGKTSFTNQEGNQDLLKVTLEYFTHEECSKAYRNNIGIRLRNGIVDGSQLCAGSHTESKDTCQGDSGGPLQIINKGVFCTYNIVGVTSFGKACGVASLPGVYTRVSNYIEWIEGIVWP